MKNTTKTLSILFVVIVLLTSACKANVSHNGDGSLNVETTISQQELQDVISDSLADPLIHEVTASLQSGYIMVTGERQRLNDPSRTDALTFRLDLGVSNGQIKSPLRSRTRSWTAIRSNKAA